MTSRRSRSCGSSTTTATFLHYPLRRRRDRARTLNSNMNSITNNAMPIMRSSIDKILISRKSNGSVSSSSSSISAMKASINRLGRGNLNHSTFSRLQHGRNTNLTTATTTIVHANLFPLNHLPHQFKIARFASISSSSAMRQRAASFGDAEFLTSYEKTASFGTMLATVDGLFAVGALIIFFAYLNNTQGHRFELKNYLDEAGEGLPRFESFSDQDVLPAIRSVEKDVDIAKFDKLETKIEKSNENVFLLEDSERNQEWRKTRGETGDVEVADITADATGNASESKDFEKELQMNHKTKSIEERDTLMKYAVKEEREQPNLSVEGDDLQVDTYTSYHSEGRTPFLRKEEDKQEVKRINETDKKVSVSEVLLEEKVEKLYIATDDRLVSQAMIASKPSEDDFIKQDVEDFLEVSQEIHLDETSQVNTFKTAWQHINEEKKSMKVNEGKSFADALLEAAYREELQRQKVQSLNGGFNNNQEHTENQQTSVIKRTISDSQERDVMHTTIENPQEEVVEAAVTTNAMETDLIQQQQKTGLSKEMDETESFKTTWQHINEEKRSTKANEGKRLADALAEAAFQEEIQRQRSRNPMKYTNKSNHYQEEEERKKKERIVPLPGLLGKEGVMLSPSTDFRDKKVFETKPIEDFPERKKTGLLEEKVHEEQPCDTNEAESLKLTLEHVLKEKRAKKMEITAREKRGLGDALAEAAFREEQERQRVKFAGTESSRTSTSVQPQFLEKKRRALELEEQIKADLKRVQQYAKKKQEVNLLERLNRKKNVTAVKAHSNVVGEMINLERPSSRDDTKKRKNEHPEALGGRKGQKHDKNLDEDSPSRIFLRKSLKKDISQKFKERNTNGLVKSAQISLLKCDELVVEKRSVIVAALVIVLSQRLVKILFPFVKYFIL